MGPAFIRAAEAALCWVEQGIGPAMTLYNRTPKVGAIY